MGSVALALTFGHFMVICVLFAVVLPVPCNSQDTFVCSRATYYGSPDCKGTPSGACGYGEYGRTVNNAYVAGVSRLFRNGSGCGACYQVRCTAPHLCSDDGVNVVVTDYGEGDNTDFIMSPTAYAGMAYQGHEDAAHELFAYGVVDVEFRRITCRPPLGGSPRNILFKIHEHSNYPHYLAIAILYVPGKSDVVGVDIWQEDSKAWIAMRRSFGAVFDIPSPPKSYINFRFHLLVGGGAELTWVEAHNAIPTDWKVGEVYPLN